MNITPEQIRLFGSAPDSIVDGPGLRYSVFTQGCTHHCPGCHNPESQPHCGGTVVDIDVVIAEIKANKLITGVTLSGGEPFEQAAACARIACACKEQGLSVWTYSGYLYEDLLRIASGEAPTQENASLLDAQGVADLLSFTDVLVDGPFVQKLKSYELKWRGSSNQRLIDVASSKRAGAVVLWEPYSFVPPKPSNW